MRGTLSLAIVVGAFMRWVANQKCRQKNWGVAA
jgi:hypothetical protein